MGEKPEWKATDSSPVNTKQKNNKGIRNQTTMKSSGKAPITTIVVGFVFFIFIFILIMILGFNS